MEFIKDFIKLKTTSGFNSVFPKNRLCTEIDVQNFLQETGDDEYIPFFICENGKFNEYYCYEKNPMGMQPVISVYSVHTYVEDWATPEAFFTWVKQIISKHAT